MNRFMATWMCVDDPSYSTYFPSSKGNSSSKRVQNIYWRCLCSFYWSARFFNPDLNLVFFSNQSEFPIVDGLDIEKLLCKLNVKCYYTKFEYITPLGYFQTWRNQFFEFSIFDLVSKHQDFKDDDLFVLVDSDCVITGNVDLLYETLEKENCLNYLFKYAKHYAINGISRNQMKLIYEDLLGTKLDSVPEYYGGEFFASDVSVMKNFMTDFYPLWENLLLRNSQGSLKFNEEAHVLSFLFFKNNFTGAKGNYFIKRMWTDPSTFRNSQKIKIA